jgi:hypothetical protein
VSNRVHTREERPVEGLARPTTRSAAHARGGRVRWLVLAGLALVTLLSWALASPPGSSPDDDYHLASIWCARGPSQHCGLVPGDPTSRVVPWEVNAVACFAFHSESSAACQQGLDTQPDAPRNLGNWNGGYPPVFYYVMSFLVTDHLGTSVFLMRSLNAVITVGMIGGLALLLPRRLRMLVTVPALVTAVPLGVSLFASTNPSSWTVLGVATFWPALYAAFETTGRRSLLLQGVAVLAMLLAAGSRADGSLFIVMSVALVLMLRLRAVRSHRWVLVTCLVCVVIPFLFFVGAGQSAALTNGLGPAPPPAPGAPPVTWVGLAVTNLQALPTLWFGSLGYGNMGVLGWLDTPFPGLVGFLATAVWLVVVFGAWRVMSRGKALAIALVGLALVVYPVVVLGRSGMTVGSGFQARYELPLLVLLAGMSLLRVDSFGARYSVFQRGVLIMSLVVAHTIALFTQIRRYVTGLDVSGLDLDHGREWWWHGPLSATAVWTIGSASFAVVCCLLLIDSVRARDGAAVAPAGTSDSEHRADLA